MQFTIDDAKALLQDQDSELFDRLKDFLLTTNTRCNLPQRLNIEELRAYFDENLEDADKTSFAPLMRLMDVHIQGEKLGAAEGNALLNWAFKNHDDDLLRLLVGMYGVNLDAAQDDHGNTLLHLLVQAGDSVGVTRLINATPFIDVDARNKEGNTPLFEAIAQGNIKLVRLLLKRGADVNAANLAGDTPLHIATKQGSLKMVAFLIEQKAQVNEKNKKNLTPLDVAVRHASIPVIRYLIKNKAEVVRASSFDIPMTCSWPARNNRFDVLSVLNDDADTPTLLAWAVREGYPYVVQHLVDECKADVNIRQANGDTLLHVLLKKEHPAGSVPDLILDFLIKGGPNLELQDKDGHTPLYYAAKYNNRICGNHKLTSLVEAGANIEIPYANGKTPLHVAVESYAYEKLKFLVTQGADINAKDDLGQTPLHYAAEMGSAKALNILIEQNADINAKDGLGKTPLHYATENENVEIVDFLVERGADINAQDDLGRTPLHIAAGEDHIDTIEFFLQAGAKVDIRNKTGHLASDNWDDDADQTDAEKLILDFTPFPGWNEEAESDERKETIARCKPIFDELRSLGLPAPKLNGPSAIKLVEAAFISMANAVDNASLGETEATRIARLDASAEKIIPIFSSGRATENSRVYWNRLKETYSQSKAKGLSAGEITKALEEVDRPSRLPKKKSVISQSSDKAIKREAKHEDVVMEDEENPDPALAIEVSKPQPVLAEQSSASSMKMETSSGKEKIERKDESPLAKTEIFPESTIKQKSPWASSSSSFFTFSTQEEKTSSVKSESVSTTKTSMPSFASGRWWDTELPSVKAKPKRKSEEDHDVSDQKTQDTQKRAKAEKSEKPMRKRNPQGLKAKNPRVNRSLLDVNGYFAQKQKVNLEAVKKEQSSSSSSSSSL